MSSRTTSDTAKSDPAHPVLATQKELFLHRQNWSIAAYGFCCCCLPSSKIFIFGRNTVLFLEIHWWANDIFLIL